MPGFIHYGVNQRITQPLHFTIEYPKFDTTGPKTLPPEKTHPPEESAGWDFGPGGEGAAVLPSDKGNLE